MGFLKFISTRSFLKIWSWKAAVIIYLDINISSASELDQGKILLLSQNILILTSKDLVFNEASKIYMISLHLLNAKRL